MPNYNLPYEIFDYVNIIAIDTTGRITTIRFSGHDIYFIVEYWLDSKLISVSLLSDELEPIKGE